MKTNVRLTNILRILYKIDGDKSMYWAFINFKFTLYNFGRCDIIVFGIYNMELGGVAQLVERCVRNAEAKGSNPSVSTKNRQGSQNLVDFTCVYAESYSVGFEY